MVVLELSFTPYLIAVSWQNRNGPHFSMEALVLLSSFGRIQVFVIHPSHCIGFFWKNWCHSCIAAINTRGQLWCMSMGYGMRQLSMTGDVGRVFSLIC